MPYLGLPTVLSAASDTVSRWFTPAAANGNNGKNSSVTSAADASHHHPAASACSVVERAIFGDTGADYSPTADRRRMERAYEDMIQTVGATQ